MCFAIDCSATKVLSPFRSSVHSSLDIPACVLRLSRMFLSSRNTHDRFQIGLVANPPLLFHIPSSLQLRPTVL